MTRLSFFKGFLGALVLGFVSLASVHAADQGNAAEAEAMAKKAVSLIKAQGPDKAYEEFTNGKSFKDRDLYISVLDFKGKVLAHGVNPKLVGKDLLTLKDPDGVLLVQVAIDVAKAKGQGWTPNYKFMNPTTQKLQSKSMYVEKVPGTDTYVAVGIYK